MQHISRKVFPVMPSLVVGIHAINMTVFSTYQSSFTAQGFSVAIPCLETVTTGLAFYHSSDVRNFPSWEVPS